MNIKVVKFLRSILVFVLSKKVRITHLIAFTKYNSFRKTSNLLHAGFNRLTKKTVVSSRPYLINSEPTNHCILKCPFCQTTIKNTRPKGFAGFDDYNKLIREYSEYVYLITFHGWGEPLMHQQLPQLIKLAHDYKICTVVTTNGMLLNPELAQQLIDSKLDVLNISIDGATAESYEKYRCGGDFNALIEKVKMLIAMKKRAGSDTPYIEWQFLVFKHNEHEVTHAKRMARETGVDNIVFLPSYTEDPDSDATDHKFRLPKHSPLSSRASCKHLWSTLTVHWNGNIVPCCYDYHGDLSYGHIDDLDNGHAWNGEIFRDARKLIKYGPAESCKAQTCRKCVEKITLN